MLVRKEIIINFICSPPVNVALSQTELKLHTSKWVFQGNPLIHTFVNHRTVPGHKRPLDCGMVDQSTTLPFRSCVRLLVLVQHLVALLQIFYFCRTTIIYYACLYVIFPSKLFQSPFCFACSYLGLLLPEHSGCILHLRIDTCCLQSTLIRAPSSLLSSPC